jgi:hypothetical protein
LKAETQVMIGKKEMQVTLRFDDAMIYAPGYTLDQFTKNYTETQDLCNASVMNIAYYSYNEEMNSYKQESLIQKERNSATLELNDGDDTIVSILLHAGITL